MASSECSNIELNMDEDIFLLVNLKQLSKYIKVCFKYTDEYHLFMVREAISAAYGNIYIQHCDFYWEDVLITENDLIPLIKSKKGCGHFKLNVKISPGSIEVDPDKKDPHKKDLLSVATFKEYLSADYQTELLLIRDATEPCVQRSIIDCAVKYLFRECGSFPNAYYKDAMISIICTLFEPLGCNRLLVDQWITEKMKYALTKRSNKANSIATSSTTTSLLGKRSVGDIVVGKTTITHTVQKTKDFQCSLPKKRSIGDSVVSKTTSTPIVQQMEVFETNTPRKRSVGDIVVGKTTITPIAKKSEVLDSSLPRKRSVGDIFVGETTITPMVQQTDVLDSSLPKKGVVKIVKTTPTKQAEDFTTSSVDDRVFLQIRKSIFQQSKFLETLTNLDDIPNIKKVLLETLEYRIKQSERNEFSVHKTYKFFSKNLELILYDFSIRLPNVPDNALENFESFLDGACSVHKAETKQNLVAEDCLLAIRKLLTICIYLNYPNKPKNLSYTLAQILQEFITFSTMDENKKHVLKDHPIIVAQGSSKKAIWKYSLQIGDVLLELPPETEFLGAFDYLMRSYYVFNVEFPKSISLFLNFIMVNVYKVVIKSKYNKKNVKIEDLDERSKIILSKIKTCLNYEI